jgi:hypothetical protein
MADNARPLDGAALDRVGRERVAVLEVLGDVGGVQRTLGACIASNDHLLLSGVHGDHGSAHAVLDRAQAVVATRDDPVTDGELVSGNVDAVAEPTVVGELRAHERVEPREPRVVARDQDRLAPLVCGLALAPGRDRRSLARARDLRVAGVDVELPAACLVVDVVGGVAAPDAGQQLALARVALARDRAELV